VLQHPSASVSMHTNSIREHANHDEESEHRRDGFGQREPGSLLACVSLPLVEIRYSSFGREPASLLVCVLEDTKRMRLKRQYLCRAPAPRTRARASLSLLCRTSL
jgi:hypothetical protein